ncbi:hypothetical protein FJ872_19475 [Mesorhizobium sp. B2-5-9]|uniref:hypothetical protein n=1 Tax=Mesorhizobium sp. B2-5-9 TaxID=2589921 RepID=UPI00112E5AA4|nr:hypothetical protein [Mesorhizobium sp. B2-5-9]TPK15180.1 hypothetical protein FJ872_19475 [Mesorhizobium sp. B2-5-9]
MSAEQTVMATPAEIAARDGVTKQAVTKLVRRLVDEHDLPVERDGRQRVVRFSLAHYDHYRGEFASSEKVAAARRDAQPAQPANPSTSRDEALRQEAWLKVGRERIRRQEQIGQLVRADRTRDALTVCGREIQASIARLQNKADDMALAVSREGAHGLRVLLRQIAFDLNTEVADKLAAIVEQAAEHDATLEDEEL